MVKTEQNGPENIVDERNFKLQSIQSGMFQFKKNVGKMLKNIYFNININM